MAATKGHKQRPKIDSRKAMLVRVDQNTYNKIKAFAEARKISMAWFINEAIQDKLNNSIKEVEILKEKAKAEYEEKLSKLDSLL